MENIVKKNWGQDPASPVFNEFHNHRCWIFPSIQLLSEWGESLSNPLDSFVTTWKNENHPKVLGHWQPLYDRFLVVAAPNQDTQISGCSMDSLIRFISALGKSLGISFLSRDIHYRNRENRVSTVSRSEFKTLVAKGVIDENSTVFDNTLTRLGDISEGKFELPLNKSWHRAFLP